MLLWAIFSTGFVLGVLVTLSVFVRKQGVENIAGAEELPDEAIDIEFTGLTAFQDSNQIHTKLIQPNYKRGSITA